MVEFIVLWDTGNKTGSNNLLTDENLSKVGIRGQDIKLINPFFHFPGSLYTEEGVAKPNHPLCGSVGINITTIDGKTASIQDLFYFDYGHVQGPLKDTPHWNRERRLVNTNGNVEIDKLGILDHVIDQTPAITIKFIDGTGKEHKQTIKQN